MSSVVARLKNNDLLLNGELDERLPVITDGLVAHFSMDGKGGTFDSIGGHQPIQHTTGSLNLIEAMNLDWRNPSSWSSNSGMSWDESKQALKIVGYHNSWLKTPIVVDTTKHYQVSMEVMEEVQSSTGLYLGGYSVNAAGERVTPNYDYSYASNAQPATGVWTTYRVTRYGTGNITSNTSTTFDKIVGWTGTRTAITDKLTKYYYYGGLFNYSSGGVMYIKNLSVVVVDADNSNCTITNDGIAVEEATTNMATGKDLGFGDGNRWESVTSYPAGLPISPVKVWRRKDTNTYWGYFSTFIPTSPTPYNRTFTVSFWYYLEPGYDGSVNSYFYGAPNEGASVYNSIGTSLNNTFSTSVKGQWLYGQQTIKITTDAYSYNYFQGWSGGSIETGKHCYIANFQLEEKPFATSFINGSRSTGRLDLSKSFMDFQSFTVFMKLRLDSLPSSGNNMYFDAYPKLYIWRTTSNHYCSWSDSAQRTLGFDIIPNQEEFSVAVTREYISSTNVITKTYYNGILKNSYTSTSEPSMNMNTNYGDFIKLHGWGNNYLANSQIKQLSFYNRALSTEEINKLANQTFQITSTGNLITSNFSERPNSIPSDAYYFPLDFEAKDEHKIISPSTETNTVYEDGSVWVGTSATNEYSYPTFNTSNSNGGWNYWGQTGASGTYGQNTDKTYIYDKVQTYSHWVANDASATGSYLLYQSPAFDGGYRSLQALVCMSDFSEVTNAKLYPAWNARNGGIPNNVWSSIERIGDSYFYLCKAEGISQDGSNDLVGIYIRPGYKAYFTWAQLEQKTFATPFVVGTRGTSDLEFNFNTSIGLDWGGNWSIIYWKKPIGTNNNTLTGYNIESLGCNSNSVGGGYIWWGKTTGSNALLSSTPSAIDPAKYFNNWRMVSLVKSGTTITIKEWSPTEGIYTRTATNSATAANYYVTQHGYDFKLGWDNTRVSNTYYKDLIVVKRTLSDAEINEIYQTQMRSYKDKLQIQGQLGEVAL